MGRTGKMWAAEHFGVVPDIITTAKGIASGLPLSAIIARAEIMKWPPGAHASTFGGNPVAVAAALATIELLENELIANAARIGGHILDRMRDWPKRFRNVGDVRGLGLMIGIELVLDQKTKERAPELRDRIQDRWPSSAACWCWARDAIPFAFARRWSSRAIRPISRWIHLRNA